MEYELGEMNGISVTMFDSAKDGLCAQVHFMGNGIDVDEGEARWLAEVLTRYAEAMRILGQKGGQG